MQYIGNSSSDNLQEDGPYLESPAVAAGLFLHANP